MNLVKAKTTSLKHWRVTTVRRTVAALVVACIAHGTAAAAELPRFHMQAALDGPAGRLIARGEYPEALALLQADTSAPNRASRMWRYTNLCVSHTLTDHLDAAIDSCNLAIENAAATSVGIYASHGPSDRLMAVLYSNRAVTYWRAGQTKLADADLATAMKYSAGYAPVRGNKAAFAARRDVVTASND